MHLYLSSVSARNCFYSTEDGHPLYKVETPSVPLGKRRRTIIRRAVDTLDGVWLGDKEECYEDLNGVLANHIRARSPSLRSATTSSYTDPHDGCSFEGHFAHLAHIEHGAMKPSRILYAGQEVRTNKLFSSKGWSWYGLSLSRYVSMPFIGLQASN
jgi:hypothetical protein